MKGFTLVEILIVVVMIAILSTLAIMNYSKATQHVSDKTSLYRLLRLTQAQEQYFLMYNQYGDLTELKRRGLINDSIAQFDSDGNQIPISNKIVEIQLSDTYTQYNTFIKDASTQRRLYCSDQYGILRKMTQQDQQNCVGEIVTQ